MPTPHFTIAVDCREQKPLPIPSTLPWLRPSAVGPDETTVARITVVARRLAIADYALDPDPLNAYSLDGVGPVVERKATLDEIGDNLYLSHRRVSFLRLLDAMASSPAPALILDGGLDITSQNTRKYPQAAVVDGLQRLLQPRRIPYILLAGRTTHQRILAGQWVARHLLNATLLPLEPPPK